jgi:hypothetical protein
MAPRARGLGRGLSDILADIPSGPAPTVVHPSDRNKFGLVGAGAFIPSGPDFGPTFVGDADEYYLGPYLSTRVKAHQFILLEGVDQRPSTMGQQFDAYTLKGLIYVRFQKKDTLWVYGTVIPFSLNDYRFFRESRSKGKAVREMESHGHRAAAEGEAAELQI